MDGSNVFARINTDPHPTPQHIRGCILDAITEHNRTAANRGLLEIPYVAMSVIGAGISEACHQHDTGEQP